jgi:dUTP pyrophosphatase
MMAKAIGVLKGRKMVRVGVKRVHPDAVLPKYAHSGDYGDLAADLFAVEEVTFTVGDVKTIATGIALEFPPGYGGIIADRSGLAKRGLTTLAGVIDPGYRGEIRVVAAYLGTGTLRIGVRDRIAQLRIVHRLDATFHEVDELGESERSDRGFGSSGK